MSHEVDFDYVRQLRGEWEAYLDSQMNISERIKLVSEVGKLLGNFERLHREVIAIHALISTQLMHTDEARAGMARLEAIALDQ